MQSTDKPSKFSIPWANSGTKNTIPTASQIGITAGKASLTDGFPPLTFTPVAAGGVPPAGADFNGILNQMTAAERWTMAGGGYPYDSDFSTAIGGYPKGARVLRSDGAGYWQSTIENNTNNPDTGGAGWYSDVGASFAFKNRLINGQLNINQRGVSGSVVLAAGVYGHDRFKAGASGCTYTFSTTGNVTTLTIASGSLIQVVEGLNLETGTYCLSWQGTAQGRINSGSYGASGAVAASIVGGTNTPVEFNVGTLSLPQLEKGSTATSFDYRPYGTELSLCQRYCEALQPSTIQATMGAFTGTSYVPAYYTYKVTKRVIPSLTTPTWVTNNTGTPALNSNTTDVLVYYASATTTGNAGFNNATVIIAASEL